jgi:hypothetical protein
MINNRTFDHRPVSELLAIVRNDFKKLDDEGMIDEGNLIKVIMYCNDRLGIPIREVKQVCMPVEDYKAKLPLNFEKLYFACALFVTNSIIHNQQNPFNNNFDGDVIYSAGLDRGTLGNVESYAVNIKRETTTTIHYHDSWISLSLAPSCYGFCHSACPNMRKPGKYQVSIDGDVIRTPFRTGEIYMMYLGTMQDEDGSILFPFHPMITPYYEWSIKERVLMNAIFNSDGDYANLLKLATLEKAKAWLDAFNITVEKGYGEYVDAQRKKELGYYNQYFKYFQ